jgi:hypothetical protein
MDDQLFMNFLTFYNNRVRFYNKEIDILTNILKTLKTKILIYMKLYDEYIKKIDNEIKIEKIMCKLCLDNLSECIIIPCKHFCCCYNCINQLETNNCPMCREPFEEYYKIYY